MPGRGSGAPSPSARRALLPNRWPAPNGVPLFVRSRSTSFSSSWWLRPLERDGPGGIGMAEAPGFFVPAGESFWGASRSHRSTTDRGRVSFVMELIGRLRRAIAGPSEGERVGASWNGAALAESDRTVVVEGKHYFSARGCRLALPEVEHQALDLPLEGSCELLHGGGRRQGQRGRRLMLPRSPTRRGGHPRPRGLLGRRASGRRRGSRARRVRRRRPPLTRRGVAAAPSVAASPRGSRGARATRAPRRGSRRTRGHPRPTVSMP